MGGLPFFSFLSFARGFAYRKWRFPCKRREVRTAHFTSHASTHANFSRAWLKLRLQCSLWALSPKHSSSRAHVMFRTFHPPLTSPSQSTITSSSLLFPSHWPTISTRQTGLLFEQSPLTETAARLWPGSDQASCLTKTRQELEMNGSNRAEERGKILFSHRLGQQWLPHQNNKEHSRRVVKKRTAEEHGASQSRV